MSTKVVYRVKLTPAELGRIKNEYPSKKDLLAKIVNPQGNYVNILLDTETACLIRSEFGDRLYDYLFAKAYGLKGEKYYSYFIQLQEILGLPKSKVSTILEIGPGYNILNALLGLYDYTVSTMDVNSGYRPTIVGDVLHMPDNIDKYDLVCAFQVLQHLPFAQFRESLNNIVKCAKRYIYISLPCPTNHVYIHFRNELLQRIFKKLSFDCRLFQTLPGRLPDRDEEALLRRPDKHNPHYWEVNRRSHSKKKILSIIEECGVKVNKHFHNNLHPYHWFILGEIK